MLAALIKLGADAGVHKRDAETSAAGDTPGRSSGVQRIRVS
jgi:hypothetical protein